MTDYPFLDRIPDIERRVDILKKLGEYQIKKYDCNLECIVDFRNGKYNPITHEEIRVDKIYEEDNIEEINKEMSGNSDIKERL